MDSLEINDVRPMLAALDACLVTAVEHLKATYGPGAGQDAFRGLYLSPNDIDPLLERAPGEGAFADETAVRELANATERLRALDSLFGLTEFERAVVALALAPEVDLRYERLYGYLQDDVTRKRPTIDLSLSLFSPSFEDKLENRTRFYADAPLLRHALIQIVGELHQSEPLWLAQAFKLDGSLTRYLLGQEGLDSSLQDVARLSESGKPTDAVALAPELRAAMVALAQNATATQQPLYFYLQSEAAGNVDWVAEILAHECYTVVLSNSLDRTERFSSSFLPRLFTAARLNNALLVLHLSDSSPTDDPNWLAALRTALEHHDGVVLLAGGMSANLPAGALPAQVIRLALPTPDSQQRRAMWASHLAGHELALDDGALDAVAQRFQLGPAQIESAVTMADNLARWRAAEQAGVEPNAPKEMARTELTMGDVFAAARAQSGHSLARLARKIEPIYGWDDLVLPEDSMVQLYEICQRVKFQGRVMETWGFGRKLAHGKGVNALFIGPSGTGKTMGSQVIARELGLDLYAIDLSGVVSKYIGETEKNLDRIFTAAQEANAILLFDEADALFGKRSEVHDSHDRYANIEISYLLQKMEQYDGVAILATNLRGNLDESFTRRLAFTIYFPFPDETSREQIWHGIFPAALPLAEDVSLDAFAHRFKFSGGNIKNIALAAAFYAASDGGRVTQEHLFAATRREYQKMGKQYSPAELKALLDEVA